jgi:hypothetical protein
MQLFHEFLPSDITMPTVTSSTTTSEQKQRKPRRDKLPSSEKHTRHLEASRNYYARYTLSYSFITIYEILIIPLKKQNAYSRRTTAPNEKVMNSAIYHFTSHHYIFFQSSTKATRRQT